PLMEVLDEIEKHDRTGLCALLGDREQLRRLAAADAPEQQEALDPAHWDPQILADLPRRAVLAVDPPAWVCGWLFGIEAFPHFLPGVAVGHREQSTQPASARPTPRRCYRVDRMNSGHAHEQSSPPLGGHAVGRSLRAYPLASEASVRPRSGRRAAECRAVAGA